MWHITMLQFELTNDEFSICRRRVIVLPQVSRGYLLNGALSEWAIGGRGPRFSGVRDGKK